MPTIFLTFAGNRAHFLKIKRFWKREERVMWHIFVSKLSFAPDAVIGVGLIGIYFVWIVCMALCRIKQGDHLHH